MADHENWNGPQAQGRQHAIRDEVRGDEADVCHREWQDIKTLDCLSRIYQSGLLNLLGFAFDDLHHGLAGGTMASADDGASGPSVGRMNRPEIVADCICLNWLSAQIAVGVVNPSDGRKTGHSGASNCADCK